MSDGKVNITRSTVHGDVAGEGIDKSTHITFSGAKGVYMKALLDRYKKECEEKPEMRDLIDDLDYYNNKRTGDVIGLEEKLKAGDREDLIWFALDYKDRFQRFLFKNQFSDAAQRIMLYLLSEVQTRFLTEIYPLVCKGETQDKINLLITERLINPVKDELGENHIGITSQHINGMMYFLTGNCHIKWTK